MATEPPKNLGIKITNSHHGKIRDVSVKGFQDGMAVDNSHFLDAKRVDVEGVAAPTPKLPLWKRVGAWILKTAAGKALAFVWVWLKGL